MPCAEQRALLEMNLRRETWCQVEVSPARAWERTERRHYRGHLRTGPVLRAALAAGGQRGAARSERPTGPERPERRHFEESYRSQLV
ncbi:spermatogenesis-associated protein 45-like [Pseudoliparis swirei]|uniref:spermatogenesis-associated protein 45-like n=1 Tax=Pseudoliparis swirei TaxID=2059687 RepID=UPI0024BD6623|nr:spermatogenesis-associated protein 45-like [Pseudoliparis swirei]